MTSCGAELWAMRGHGVFVQETASLRQAAEVGGVGLIL